MAPSVQPGDYLAVTRRRRIARGDVVVVRRPGRDMELLKRVVGLPGERAHGVELGPDEYLVVGDNAALSTDGRTFGPVRRDAILGVVRFRYWPRPGRVGMPAGLTAPGGRAIKGTEVAPGSSPGRGRPRSAGRPPA
jgi:signal peptidase I